MAELEDKRIMAEIDERLASMKKLLSEHELNQKKTNAYNAEMEERRANLEAERAERQANIQKLLSESDLNQKKTKWYEWALVIAISATIATIIAKM